jgi:2-amino-4-hydroxy-6-hydroxymethyldihydropteridine diphosphokinase
MINVFLLLGSNLGDRQTYLQQAVAQIKTEIGPVVRESSVYETQSWGKTDEPDYLNQVIEVQTDMPAIEILHKILHIELVMGRKRDVKWGSRTIDIDILFYGSQIINQEGLTVPHPELHNRMFTLAPLAEIAPDLVHPVLKENITGLKSKLKSHLHVKKL